MKKIIAVIILLLVFTSFSFGNTNLKINPGTWLVGGGFSYLYSQAIMDNSNPHFNIVIGTLTGFFITPNTMVGIRIDIGFSTIYDTSKNADFVLILDAIGIQGRFLASHTETVNFYFGIDVSFGMVFSFGDKVPLDNIIGKENMKLGIPAGIYIPLNPHIALDIAIQPTFLIPLDSGGVAGIGIPVIIGFAMFI